MVIIVVNNMVFDTLNPCAIWGWTDAVVISIESGEESLGEKC
jgi:hypothetical protein